MKRTAFFLALLMALCLFTACGGESAGNIAEPNDNSVTVDSSNAKQYTLDCGISITAEKGLTESQQPSFTAVLDGRNMAVMFLAESKALMPAGSTLDDYANLIESGNKLSTPFTEDSDGNLYNSYSRTIDGDDFFYALTVKESPDSFWLIQMSCREKDRAHYEPLFAQWLATVELPDSAPAANKTLSERSYSMNCGLSITMCDNMGEFMMEGFDEFYTNNEAGMVLIVEEKPDGYTLEDYCAAVEEANNTEDLIPNEYGTPFTTFSIDVEGMTYYYFLSTHEFSDSFVLCQFFCLDSFRDKYEPLFPVWAASLSE